MCVPPMFTALFMKNLGLMHPWQLYKHWTYASKTESWGCSISIIASHSLCHYSSHKVSCILYHHKLECWSAWATWRWWNKKRISLPKRSSSQDIGCHSPNHTEREVKMEGNFLWENWSRTEGWKNNVLVVLTVDPVDTGNKGPQWPI